MNIFPSVEFIFTLIQKHFWKIICTLHGNADNKIFASFFIRVCRHTFIFCGKRIRKLLHIGTTVTYTPLFPAPRTLLSHDASSSHNIDNADNRRVQKKKNLSLLEFQIFIYTSMNKKAHSSPPSAFPLFRTIDCREKNYK